MTKASLVCQIFSEVAVCLLTFQFGKFNCLPIENYLLSKSYLVEKKLGKNQQDVKLPVGHSIPNQQKCTPPHIF